MRQATSAGKVALAVLSLLLTVLIWWKGLEESFSRPSVVPKLSLRQQEISLLAVPAVPLSLGAGLPPAAPLPPPPGPPKTDEKGEGFSAKLWSIDLTGYNERQVPTKTDASDPSWSSLLSN